MTTVNIPLLRKVLDHVTAHPEEHNQSMWGVRTSCGTAYCIAGHALVMSGVQLGWEDTADGYGYATVDVTKDGEQIHDAARRVLGLDDVQAYLLFDPNNSRDRAWAIAADITDGKIQRPMTS